MDEREIVSSRAFAVTPDALFEAVADPARLSRWWGPRGFRTEFHEFDLQPGGRWRFDLIGPDGARYPQDKTFIEVARPTRIVLRHAQVGHDFVMTMTFAEADGGTRLTWHMRFASAEELAPVADPMRAGNEENFDRLADHLNARRT